MDILFRKKNINFELIKRITKCRANWAGIGKQTDKKIICDLHADMVAVVSKSRSHRRGFTTIHIQCIPNGILQKLNSQQSPSFLCW